MAPDAAKDLVTVMFGLVLSAVDSDAFAYIVSVC